MNQVQRIHVETDPECAMRLKICVESFDEKLGWYPSASLTLPLHQLPLLEQALQGVRCANCVNENCANSKVIRFPGMAEELPALETAQSS